MPVKQVGSHGVRVVGVSKDGFDFLVLSQLFMSLSFLVRLAYYFICSLCLSLHRAAFESGLKVNDVILYLNEEKIST